MINVVFTALDGAGAGHQAVADRIHHLDPTAVPRLAPIVPQVHLVARPVLDRLQYLGGTVRPVS